MLVIETDLGCDPDDFFTICWLIGQGVEIDAITIVPGAPNQIAIAELIRDYTDSHFVIGYNKKCDNLTGGMHDKLLKKHGRSLEGKPDYIGTDVFPMHMDSDYLCIGPMKNLGDLFKTTNIVNLGQKIVFQGGFVPYSIHSPEVRLDKFENKEFVPTFNFNGDRKAAVKMHTCGDERWYVGKNVCHTVEYTRELHKRLRVQSRAMELFQQGMDLYLKKHEKKKFHDPLAACMYLYPELGVWLNGRPKKMESGWTTELAKVHGLGYCPDKVLVDIVNREAFWEKILNEHFV
jgi:pyrimidine-specific ribonucleoside hydrolase